MVEIYLRLLDVVLTPLLLLISVILMLRGHDLPGGGFIAGLLAASAFALQILARGAQVVERTTGRWLVPISGIGLLIAVASALFGPLAGGAFFESHWFAFDIGTVHVKLGTPVTFDIGVFLAVVGVSVSFLLGLSKGIIGAPPPPPPPPVLNRSNEREERL